MEVPRPHVISEPTHTLGDELTLSGPAFWVVHQAREGVSEAWMPKIKVLSTDGQIEKVAKWMSRISRIFFSNFYKSTDVWKSRIFIIQVSVFAYRLISKRLIYKSWRKKSAISVSTWPSWAAEMKFCMSHFSHTSMPHAKFESGSFSNFGNMTSQNFSPKKRTIHRIQVSYIPGKWGKWGFMVQNRSFRPKIDPMSISAISKQKKFLHFLNFWDVSEKRTAKVLPLPPPPPPPPPPDWPLR